jgi:hypothetical protein
MKWASITTKRRSTKEGKNTQTMRTSIKEANKKEHAKLSLSKHDWNLLPKKSKEKRQKIQQKTQPTRNLCVQRKRAKNTPKNQKKQEQTGNLCVTTNTDACLQCDLWSLGITIIEMAESLPPRTDLPPPRVMKMVVTSPAPVLADPYRYVLAWVGCPPHSLSTFVRHPHARSLCTVHVCLFVFGVLWFCTFVVCVCVCSCAYLECFVCVCGDVCSCMCLCVCWLCVLC